MIPRSVTAALVLEAIRTVDRDGVPRGRASRGYDLVHHGRRYPPKYVVALAIEAATGRLPTSEDFGGGDETNTFLQGLGFTVVAKGDATLAPDSAGVQQQRPELPPLDPALDGAPAAEDSRRRTPPTSVRIAVFSFRWGTQETEWAALDDAFAEARRGWGGDLVVLLPGYGKFWHDPNRIAALAVRHRANVLFEKWLEGGARFVALDVADGSRVSEHIQLFVDSKDANKNPGKVSRLLAECEPGGARRFSLGGLDIGLLVCGENNLLVNEQAEGNSCAGVRGHPGRGLFADTAIVHNGAHTLMGNWSKLNARFEWLSQNGRLMTYATNNNTAEGPWRRAVRVYFDGQRVADGEDGGAVGEVAVGVLRDPHDQYRGLMTHLPKA